MASEAAACVRSDVTLRLPMYIVDAFTDTPFKGNPAAVCLLSTDQNLSDDVMQQLAAEMNLSETAFVQELDNEKSFATGANFGLRWFTPTNEVPLCGHATLASAAVLFHCVGNAQANVSFETLSGTLVAQRQGDSIRLDMPLASLEPQDLDDVASLVKAAVGDLLIDDVVYSASTKKLLVRLHDKYSRAHVKALRPDTASLLAAHNTGRIKGLIVTLRGSQENGCVRPGDGLVYDFISRYFAPWNGIPEDPITGSAHTVLCKYWSTVLGKRSMLAEQCSPRGGELVVELADDDSDDSKRVYVLGKAVVVLAGSVSYPLPQP